MAGFVFDVSIQIICSFMFFCHCHKRTKKSRKEGYTAPSFHIAMFRFCTTVAFKIDLYSTPLMLKVLVIADSDCVQFKITCKIHTLENQSN